jgi:hypothetical protein
MDSVSVYSTVTGNAALTTGSLPGVDVATWVPLCASHREQSLASVHESDGGAVSFAASLAALPDEASE